MKVKKNKGKEYILFVSFPSVKVFLWTLKNIMIGISLHFNDEDTMREKYFYLQKEWYMFLKQMTLYEEKSNYAQKNCIFCCCYSGIKCFGVLFCLIININYTFCLTINTLKYSLKNNYEKDWIGNDSQARMINLIMMTFPFKGEALV